MASVTRGSTGVTRLSREQFQQQVLESEQPVLVILQAEGVDDRTFVTAITNVLQKQSEDLKVVAINVKDIQDILEQLEQNKTYHTYDLKNLPAAGLFRNGDLVTTFNPRISSREALVQRSAIERQFRLFLDKFVHYDPEKLTFNHK